MDDTPNLKNTFENFGKALSLERMCFDLIVQKFERFYFAFTISNNANLLRNFEFLQRRYSFQLLTVLYEKKNLEEEYFEILINEHLHFLKGEWIKSSCYIKPTEDIFRHLPNLTRVCFWHCDDEVLGNISKFCPNIVEIDVRFSNVTDVGVMHLCGKTGMVPCPQIKVLSIVDSDVTDFGAEYLIRKLPLLEKIDYPNVHLLLHSIFNESLSKHKKIHSYNLVEINLLVDEYMYLVEDENMYENGDEYFRFYFELLKTCLFVCPKLESVACFITDEEQLNVFNNSHLKKLTLYGLNTNSKLNINNFIKMYGRNLTSLKIKKCTISVSVLAGNCPVLEKFNVPLGDVNFTDADDNAPVIFRSLIKCSLSDIRPSDAKALCSLLSFSPKLKSLKFLSCILSLEMKNKILMWCTNSSAQLMKFRHLFLEMKFVRDILLSCHSLKAMVFVNCSFDSHEAKGIFKMLAKKLPNKPSISLRHYVLGKHIYPVGFNYLSRHPEEKYRTSTAYDSLFREIDRNYNDHDSNEEISGDKDAAFYYLSKHPEEKYKTSTTYDSLFRRIDRNFHFYDF